MLEHEKRLNLAPKGDCKVATGNHSEGKKNKNAYQLYEAPDGFRGSYEEVLEHEKRYKLTQQSYAAVGDDHGDANDKVVVRIYEADDGFRGTYDEVAAHEKKNKLKPSGDDPKVTVGGDSEDNDRVLLRIYEAEDGFRGSYGEVLEHEEKMTPDMNRNKSAGVTANPGKSRIKSLSAGVDNGNGFDLYKVAK